MLVLFDILTGIALVVQRLTTDHLVGIILSACHIG